MYEINVDRFKALPPWRDPSFYIALATALVAIAFDLHSHGGVTQTSIAGDAAPIGLWLIVHGYVRGAGAKALGTAVAGSRYVDVKGDQPIADTVPTQTEDEAAAA